MKKIAIGALAVCFLTSCTNINKDELKQEIKEDLKKEMAETYPKVVKGDGSYFYNESVSIGGDEFFIHHSTMQCPAIKNGVQRGCYKLNGYNNTFCSHCMDDALINRFNAAYFPNGYKK